MSFPSFSSFLRIATIAALTAGCGGVAESAPSNTQIATRSLTGEISAVALSFCLCHHGFGAGVDGNVTFRVTNTGSAAQQVAFGALTIVAASHYPASNLGSVTVDGKLWSPTAPFVVASGATVTVSVTPYVDGPQHQSDVATSTVALDLVTDAGTLHLESPPVRVTDETARP
jgi:hypothetical protein